MSGPAMIATAVGILTLVSSGIGAYAYLDSRHAHQVQMNKVEQEVAGYIKQTTKQSKRDQDAQTLFILEATGQCKQGKLKALCDKLRRDLNK